jgi:hypothetical protein
MNIELKAPDFSIYTSPFKVSNSIKIFLAGSIEMGNAVDWQTKVVKELNDFTKDLIFLNPRRDSWDSSWVQSIENEQFYEQVTWELDALDKSDYIFMYFDPNTKSPISLLELGLYASSRKLIVACPDGFWRKGNVEVVCERFDIPLLNNLEDLISHFISKFN